MRHLWGKVFCLLLAAILFFAGGCGMPGGDDLSRNPDSAKKNSMQGRSASGHGAGGREAGSGEAGADDRITLRILHYYGNTDTDVAAYDLQRLLETEFAEAFPNVELIQEICDTQTYKRKIRMLMAADELPDIMFGYGGGFSEVFVEKGKLLPLDAYLDDFYTEHLDRRMQENFIYEDQLYGICFSYWTGVLYCNRELFMQAGVDIPKTYEELIQVSRVFREKGIEPVACGMLNRWHGQQWLNNFTMQLGGAGLYNAMARGKKSLDNKVLKQAAALTEKLISEGVFCSDMYRLDSSEAEELFLNGETAMIYIGNWYTRSAEERLGDKLEAVKMPVVPGALETNDYHGGAVNGWMVSADTAYPRTAANIAAWLGYRLGCCQPEIAAFRIEPEDISGEISRCSEKIVGLYSEKADGGAAWDTLMPPKKTDIWLNKCAELFAGKINSGEFARMLDDEMRQGELLEKQIQ